MKIDQRIAMNCFSQVAVCLLIGIAVAVGPLSLKAQEIVEEFSQALQIPSVIDIKATPLHLYILSETEGLVVFRQNADSLQWLYTSSGMQRRGSLMETDVRFAYIYGNGRRLGVIEPTSVLGVYSSTTLPAVPLRVARTGLRLWVALGETGLGAVSLDSPEAVDQGTTFPFREHFSGHKVLEVVSEPSSTLFVLTESPHDSGTGTTDNPPERWLHTLEVIEADSVSYVRKWTLISTAPSPEISHIHLVNSVLYASNAIGEMFRVLVSEEQQLRLEYITSFGHEIDQIGEQSGKLFVRTRNGRLWIGNREEGFSLERQDAEAGNYLAVSHHGVYLSQFDRITPLILLSERNSALNASVLSGQFQDSMTQRSETNADLEQNRSLTPELIPIPDQILPIGTTMIVAIEQERALSPDRIEFTLLNQVSGAFIRGQSLYWKPGSGQTGRTTFTILATSASGATDTTSFVADVRPFNAPPLFAPSRPISIPAAELFETEFRATDPDGDPATLIRYLGVDLPTGARLNEQTGTFVWTPEIRQTGTHRFRIVATDQYGAATTMDIDIQVIEL